MPNNSLEIIDPPSLSPPKGYANVVVVPPGAQQVLISGQIGTTSDGEIVATDDLVAQFDQTLTNIATAIEAAGGSLTDIARMRIYATDVSNYRELTAELGQVWRSHFGRYYPAMTLVGVSELFHSDALVEIDAEGYLS